MCQYLSVNTRCVCVAVVWPQLQRGGSGREAEEAGGDVPVGGVPGEQVSVLISMTTTRAGWSTQCFSSSCTDAAWTHVQSVTLSVSLSDWFQRLPRKWRNQNRDHLQLPWAFHFSTSVILIWYLLHFFILFQCKSLRLFFFFFLSLDTEWKSELVNSRNFDKEIGHQNPR